MYLHIYELYCVQAKEMVGNIIEEFSHQLQNAEWMDDPTKISALQKVKNMILFVGYPDWFKNSSALYSFYDGVSWRTRHDCFAYLIKSILITYV